MPSLDIQAAILFTSISLLSSPVVLFKDLVAFPFWLSDKTRLLTSKNAKIGITKRIHAFFFPMVDSPLFSL